MVSPTVSTVHVRGQQLRIHFSPGPAGAAGPPFVLVHGIGMSHRYLDRLHGVLSAAADTYSVDLPGFGPNPNPRGTFSIQDHGNVLLDLLADQGIGSAVLIGHSMGAQIATAAARQAPELAAGLVLIGPVVDRRRRSVWRQAAALGHDSLRELPSANLIVLTDYLRTGIRWYLREVRPMMDYRLEEEIGQVACPVLVLRGSRDPVAREPWCRELSEAARAGTFKDIPGQPHVAQHGAPHLTAEAILAFTAGLRPGLAGPGRDAARDPELPRH